MVYWFICPKVWEESVHGDIKHYLGENYFEFDRTSTGEYEETTGRSFSIIGNNPVILRGPIKFVNVMLRKYPNINFITNFKDGFYCNQYLSEFPKEWFLNSEGYFTTFGLLRQTKISNDIFIRPNSPYKPFTGLTLTKENFDIEINSLEKISLISNSEFILVSDNKTIDSEFRYVICNNEVLAYSEYRWDNVLDIRRDTLSECYELAVTVSKYKKQIDDIYVVDIGMVEGVAKIIEFNSFSSSGFYACDLEKIVEGVTRYAEKTEIY